MAARASGWRKLAGASWRPPADPQFYGDLEVDAASLLSYIESVRAATGVHVTVTHLVGKAVAYGLTAVPQLGVRLARGRVHPRRSVDVFFIVAAEGGRELSGVKVCYADHKGVVEIAREVRDRVSAIGDGRDPELGRGKALLTALPPRLLRLTLRAAAWLTSDLDLDLTRFGMPRQAFGGAMITSVGMWGITKAYSPLASYYRVPVLVLVGAVHHQAVVVAGSIVARPILTLTATFDHRYTDGFHAARFAAAVRDYLADPAAFDGRSPQPSAAAGVHSGADADGGDGHGQPWNRDRP